MATSTPTSTLSTTASIPSPVVELTEEVKQKFNSNFYAEKQTKLRNVASIQLTPKRPLRSEVEREKRLSRPTSIISTGTKESQAGIDTHSLSGDSSNRNSISKLLWIYFHAFEIF